MHRVPALALASVLLVGACGGPDGDGSEAVSTTASVVLPPATRTTAGDLGELVVTDAPSPYVPAPDFLPDGPFDLESFLEDFSIAQDEDRRLLTACGFDRGFSRVWIDEDAGRGLAVFVLECSSNASASDLADGLEAQDGRLKGATIVGVPTISGAQGRTYLENVEGVEGGRARVDIVTFVRGRRLYLTQAQSESTEGHFDLVVELATSEAAIAR